MPDVNLGALTIPIFSAIFGAGWASCYAVLVRPLTIRVERLEAEQSAQSAARDRRLADLEKRLGFGGVD